MGNKLYEENDIQSIANAIRSKGVSGTMKVSQMASKVLEIPEGSTLVTDNGEGYVIFNGVENEPITKCVLYGDLQRSGEPSIETPSTFIRSNSNWQFAGKNIANPAYKTVTKQYQLYDTWKALLSTSTFSGWETLENHSSVGKTMTFSCDVTFNKDFSGNLAIYVYQQNGLVINIPRTDILTPVSGSTRHVSFTNPIVYTLINTSYSKGQIMFYPTVAGDRVENSFEISNIQLEYGSIETTYEPYINNGTINTDAIELLSIPGTDVHDEYDAISGILTKRVDKIVLDGSQTLALSNWRPFSGTSAWVYPYKGELYGNNTKPMCIVSSSVATASYTDIYNGTVGIGIYYNTTYGICIRVPVDNLYRPPDISSWLSDHPITVYFALANPVKTYVGSASISQSNGVNTAFQISGDIKNTDISIVHVGKHAKTLTISKTMYWDVTPTDRYTMLIDSTELGEFYQEDLTKYKSIHIRLAIDASETLDEGRILEAVAEYPYVNSPPPDTIFYSSYARYFTTGSTRVQTATKANDLSSPSNRQIWLRTPGSTPETKGFCVYPSATYPLLGTYHLTATFELN